MHDLTSAYHAEALDAQLQRMERTFPYGLRVSTLSAILTVTSVQALTKRTGKQLIEQLFEAFGKTSRLRALREATGLRSFGLVSNGFGNSCTFEYMQDGRMRSLKLFLNGKVQCCGIQHFSEMPRVAHLACQVLNTLLRRPRHDIRPSHMVLSFINATVRLPFCVKTPVLYEALYPQLLGNIRMSPKVYKRLTLVLHGTSIMLFHSGNAIFTGCKSLDQLDRAHGELLTLLETHAASATVPRAMHDSSPGPARKRGRKRTADTYESFIRSFVTNRTLKGA